MRRKECQGQTALVSFENAFSMVRKIHSSSTRSAHSIGMIDTTVFGYSTLAMQSWHFTEDLRPTGSPISRSGTESLIRTTLYCEIVGTHRTLRRRRAGKDYGYELVRKLSSSKHVGRRRIGQAHQRGQHRAGRFHTFPDDHARLLVRSILDCIRVIATGRRCVL